MPTHNIIVYSLILLNASEQGVIYRVKKDTVMQGSQFLTNFNLKAGSKGDNKIEIGYLLKAIFQLT